MKNETQFPFGINPEEVEIEFAIKEANNIYNE